MNLVNIYTVLLFSIYVSKLYCEKQLLLTPYIKSGDIAKARSLSRVTALPNAPNVESYTGFITVDEKYNSNTFFWFIPAFKNPKTAPVLVYTEGGPGGSSIMSMFMFGTFNINDKLNVTINPYTLNQEFSIIYVDNPVGTGFSYTDNPNGYSTDQLTIAKNLYEFLQQFYTVFDDYRSNDLYLGGLSYAGKYVPSFGHYLIKMSQISKINFKGILIGNGLTDPINQLTYDKILLNLGLIDENEAKEVQNIQKSFKGFAKSKDYRKATEVFLKLILSASYLTNITGYQGFYDIDNSGNKLESSICVDQYVTQPSVRSAIHVGNVVFNMTSQVVFEYMFEDFSRSAEPNLTSIIDNGSKVLLFTGNFDIMVGVESINGLLMNQNWKYYNDYNRAKRDIWRVNRNDTQIAGYAKSFGNFTHVIVRNAGHASLFDQPRATHDMAIRFVKSIPFGY